MKTILTLIMLLMGSTAIAQNYNDLFTTYQDVQTQPTRKQKQSTRSYNNQRYNNGVTQYQVMDADKFYQSVAPQNIQTVTGVFVYNGQLYSVKLKVGVSGTNRNQMVVSGYWDGQMWNNSTSYASPIGYGAPDQIKRACTHQTYIATLGTVYF